VQPAVESDPTAPMTIRIRVRTLDDIGQLTHVFNKQIPFKQVLLRV
jgi:hypothetical protein